MAFKKLFFVVLMGFVNHASAAVECTFSVTDAATHAVETTVFKDQEPVTVVSLKGFTASYSVDVENQIETLGLTLPSGASSAPFYKLGSLNKMGILAKLENGVEASFICIRL